MMNESVENPQPVDLVGPFHQAVREDEFLRVRELLQQDKGLINTPCNQDPRKPYPLHITAQHGHAETARLLLDHGAQVDSRDAENDATPLGWAAFFGRPAVARVLIHFGADLGATNKHGLTPLQCAQEGAKGSWSKFSDARQADWELTAELIADEFVED